MLAYTPYTMKKWKKGISDFKKFIGNDCYFVDKSLSLVRLFRLKKNPRRDFVEGPSINYSGA